MRRVVGRPMRVRIVSVAWARWPSSMFSSSSAAKCAMNSGVQASVNTWVCSAGVTV